MTTLNKNFKLKQTKKCLLRVLSVFVALFSTIFLTSIPAYSFEIDSDEIVYGGAIMTVNSNLNIIGGVDKATTLTLSNNTSDTSGGAMYVRNDFYKYDPMPIATVNINGYFKLMSNISYSFGGGMYFYCGNSADVVTMKVNIANDSNIIGLKNYGARSYWYGGGAVMAFAGLIDVDIDGVMTFTENRTNGSGGALLFYFDRGYGKQIIDFKSTSNITGVGNYSSRGGGTMVFHVTRGDREQEVNFKGMMKYENNSSSEKGSAFYFWIDQERSKPVKQTVDFGGTMEFINNGRGINRYGDDIITKRGGAIFMWARGDDRMAETNASFTGNMKFEGNVAEYAGGAIYVGVMYSPKSVNVDFGGTMEFINNEVLLSSSSLHSDKYGGGAIAMRREGGSGSVNANFSGSMVLTGNKSVLVRTDAIYDRYDNVGGGALFFDKCSDINFIGTMYLGVNALGKTVDDEGNSLGNIDPHRGGAMYFSYCSEINFEGELKLIGNKTTLISDGYGGGAIFFNACSEINFKGVMELTENTASYDGGAMYFDNCSNVDFGVDSDLTFIKNKAHKLSFLSNYGNGGAIFFRSSSGTRTINFNGKMELIENKTYSDGGAMSFENTNSAKINVYFNVGSDTDVIRNDGNYGAGLNFTECSDVRFAGDLLLDGNTSESSSSMEVSSFIGGGAMFNNCANVYFDEGDSSTITTVINNTASSGGGLNFTSTSNIFINGKMLVDNNEATKKDSGGGGFAFWSAENVQINGDIKVTNNFVNGAGAGLLFNECSVVTIAGKLDISNNNVDIAGSGGAGITMKDNGTVNIYGIININDNHADNPTNITGGYGGGLSVINSENLAFGGYFNSGVATKVDGSSISVNNNTAGVHGAGLYIQEVHNVHFLGGSRSGEIGINGGLTVSGNEAQGTGGGITILNNNGISGEYNIYFAGAVKISNNKASGYGGGMYFQNQTLINFSGDLMLTDNENTNIGGGMFFLGGSVVMSGNIVMKNNTGNSGALYLTNSVMAKFSGTFITSNNKASPITMTSSTLCAINDDVYSKDTCGNVVSTFNFQ